MKERVSRKIQGSGHNFRKPLSYIQKNNRGNLVLLHQSIGNQAVQRLFNSGVIQPKLRIGAPGDIHEQEADRVSEQVMRMTDEDVRVQRFRGSAIQRKPG
ncbi:MAG: hypothetical protein GXO97_02280 [Nitrospirae bacterium]|nr:hypothetical protein [Nitrospirota bacterium]